MMPAEHKTILERLAEEAIHLGADMLDVDYKDGYEEVFAMKRGVGHAIAMLRSSSAEAAALRDELHAAARRKRRMTVDGREWELQCRVSESFGEDAFRVRLRRA